MTLSLDALTQPVLIAAVGGLVAGPIGYAIVQGAKRIGLKGKTQLRGTAWFICSVLVAAGQVAASNGGWRDLIVTLLVLSGAGGVAGAATAHVIRERTRGLPADAD